MSVSICVKRQEAARIAQAIAKSTEHCSTLHCWNIRDDSKFKSCSACRKKWCEARIKYDDPHFKPHRGCRQCYKFRLAQSYKYCDACSLRRRERVRKKVKAAHECQNKNCTKLRDDLKYSRCTNCRASAKNYRRKRKPKVAPLSVTDSDNLEIPI